MITLIIRFHYWFTFRKDNNTTIDFYRVNYCKQIIKFIKLKSLCRLVKVYETRFVYSTCKFVKIYFT